MGINYTDCVITCGLLFWATFRAHNIITKNAVWPRKGLKEVIWITCFCCVALSLIALYLPSVYLRRVMSFLLAVIGISVCQIIILFNAIRNEPE